MPTGDRRRQSERGFTYLLLLFAMVIGGIGLSALGEQARQRALRDQEVELQFRGEEIARAIASYVDAGPGASRALPASIEDLLEDRRSGHVVRHLRQWRPDPLGGRWRLLGPGEAGCSVPARPDGRAVGLSGVRSDSRRPLLRRERDEPQLACDKVFDHRTYLMNAAPAAAGIAVSP